MQVPVYSLKYLSTLHRTLDKRWQKRHLILNQKFYKYVSTAAFCTYNVSLVSYRGITLENIRLLGGAGSTFINNCNLTCF